MKLAKNKTSLHSSGNETSSLNFSIGNAGVIIDILRKRLYSHPHRTMIQEYLCNARDASREAGRGDQPLEVVLPTKLDSVLKIRDFGNGLSPERTRDVFVKYGSSTKRDDNTQTGGFGIGAKSAWAYTDSFTVVSIFEGTKYTYVAHLGKNSEGSFDLIDEEPTTEASGVCVMVPIEPKDILLTILAVFRCTYFWKVKPTFVGISQVEIPQEYTDAPKKYFKGEGYEVSLNKLPWLDKSAYEALAGEKNSLSDLLTLVSRSRSRDLGMWAVIDGVPYDVTRAVKDKLRRNFSAMHYHLFLETGDVQINANREEIVFDADAEKLINKKVEAMLAHLQSQIETLVGGSSSLKSLVGNLTQEKETKLVLYTLSQEFSFDLDIKKQKVKVVSKKAGTFEVNTGDKWYSADMREQAFMDVRSLSEAGLVLPMTANNNDFREYLRSNVPKFRTFIQKSNLHNTWIVKTKNVDLYSELQLRDEKGAELQGEVMKNYAEFLKERETKREKERQEELRRQEKRRKQEEERERARLERETLIKKFGSEVKASNSGTSITLKSCPIEENLNSRDWFYLVEDKVPTSFTKRSDLKQKVWLAHKHFGKRVVFTDTARLSEVLKLKIPSLLETLAEHKATIPAEEKKVMLTALYCSHSPKYITNFMGEFEKQLAPYLSAKEKTALGLFLSYRQISEDEGTTSFKAFKVMYPEEFETSQKQVIEHAKTVAAWVDKYSFIKVLNYQTKAWQKEVLALLEVLGKKEKKGKKKA